MSFPSTEEEVWLDYTNQTGWFEYFWSCWSRVGFSFLIHKKSLEFLLRTVPRTNSEQQQFRAQKPPQWRGGSEEKRQDRLEPIESSKHSSKHVWCASLYGHSLPSSNGQSQQDNAPCHKTKGVSNCFHKPRRQVQRPSVTSPVTRSECWVVVVHPCGTELISETRLVMWLAERVFINHHSPSDLYFTSASLCLRWCAYMDRYSKVCLWDTHSKFWITG